MSETGKAVEITPRSTLFGDEGIPRPGEDLLMPQSEQLPFDRDLNEIFQILKDRNWNVPGIQVEFRRFGPNNTEHVQPDTIIGPDFALHLGRRQGRLEDGYWNNASVSRIVIDQEEFGAYKEHPSYSESRRTMDPGDWSIHYARYSGENWEQDKGHFFTRAKFENNPENPWDYYSGAWTPDPEAGYQVKILGAMPPYLRYSLQFMSRAQKENAIIPPIVSYDTQKTIQRMTELVRERILRPLQEGKDFTQV